MFPRGLDGTLLSCMASDPGMYQMEPNIKGAFQSWNAPPPPQFYLQEQVKKKFKLRGVSLKQGYVETATAYVIFKCLLVLNRLWLSVSPSCIVELYYSKLYIDS